MQITEKNQILEKFSYLSKFITRAFFIAFLGVILIIFGIILVYYADLYMNVKSGNYKSPIFNGYIIVSPSMVPTIKINDAIVVKRNNNNDYIIGDIISFYSTEYDPSGMVVTHRIVNKNNISDFSSTYITKGDNNTVADKNSVITDNIYGKVLFIIPKLGFVKNFVSKPLNVILLILIPSLLILLVDFARIGILFKKNVKIA